MAFLYFFLTLPLTAKCLTKTLTLTKSNLNPKTKS